MTYEELDALPVSGGIGFRDEKRDGVLVRIPVMEHSFALFQGPDDVMLVIDRKGITWTTGWYNGVLYKRRMGSRA